MSLYQQILGNPFVYNKVRPLLLGGLDMSPVYSRLGVLPTDTVVDVGCGTGIALDYLPPFASYIGFDTDEVALRDARTRSLKSGASVQFEARVLHPDDVDRWRPDVAVLAGLLHHLTDDECVALLESLRRSARLRRVATLDVSFFPGQHLNNLFTRLDRGKYPRLPETYEAIARRAGYRVAEGVKVPSHPGGRTFSYWVMTLTPIGPPASR